jgi:hypothetical protein
MTPAWTFMKRPRRRNPVAVALYLNAGVLLAILAVLLARGGGADQSLLPGAFAQAQPPGIAGGAGVFIMPAQFSTTVWGCYLMDVDQQTLCAYTCSGSPPQLRLVAARNFRWDRGLKNYNTGSPSPQEVQDLIAKEASSGRVIDRTPAQPTSPEQAPKSK